MKKGTILILLLLIVTFIPNLSLGGGSSEFSFDKAEAEGYVAFVINEKVSSSIDIDDTDKKSPDPDIDKCACEGTGVITHGDGHKTPCPYHSQKDDDEEDLMQKKQVIFFTAKWCVPCQLFKSAQIPKLKKSGWKISDKKDAQIRIVDIDKNKEFWNKYKINNSVPSFLLFEKGKMTDSLSGLKTATQIANMYNKK
jgi:thiol-disulfide isomerase/thioredoxin